MLIFLIVVSFSTCPFSFLLLILCLRLSSSLPHRRICVVLNSSLLYFMIGDCFLIRRLNVTRLILLVLPRWNPRMRPCRRELSFASPPFTRLEEREVEECGPNLGDMPADEARQGEGRWTSRRSPGLNPFSPNCRLGQVLNLSHSGQTQPRHQRKREGGK